MDLVVLVVYLAGTTAWGAWLGRGQTGGSDYFLGRHAIPWPAVMLSVVTAKFHPEAQPMMAAKLLGTGEAFLVEGNSWGDVYWGVDAVTGVGQNQLGVILMAVRASMAAKLEDLV